MNEQSIPKNIYRIIQEMLETAVAGKVVLNINGGRIESAQVERRILPERE